MIQGCTITYNTLKSQLKPNRHQHKCIPGLSGGLLRNLLPAYKENSDNKNRNSTKTKLFFETIYGSGWLKVTVDQGNPNLAIKKQYFIKNIQLYINI